MGRVFIDGFESGSMDLWDSVGDFSVSASSPAKGSYCAVSSGTVNMKKDISANGEYYFKWRYRETDNTSPPDGKALIAVYSGATLLLNVVHRSDERLEAKRAGSVSLGIGTYTSLNNTWHLLEARILISDTVGICQVKIDGILDIDLTNIDTKPSTETTIDSVQFGISETYHGARVDDIVIDDAAWIGDTEIQAIVPTAGGNSTGWTPSAGSNFACVDEIPPSDADYVSINANDVSDTYVTGDLTGSIDNIKCVQVQSRTRTEGAPTPTNLKLVIRSSGADYLSADNTVPAAEKSLYNLWATDPATSVAWLEAGVNAIEIGIKSAA